MVPTYFNKIVSLHLQICHHECVNRFCCYHINKKWSNGVILDADREINSLLCIPNSSIHESICFLSGNSKIYDKLLNFKNYNITISCNIIPESFLFYDQIQVTVYNLHQIRKFKEYQKLYLVRNLDDLNFMYELFNKYTDRLHFLFNQNLFKTNKINIPELINKFQNRKDDKQSLDSCFTGYLINGECPYSYNNYIDITFDNTIRKCPYLETGIKIEKPIVEYFNLEHKPTCIYSTLFKEI